MPISLHQTLILYCPVLGAFAGFFLALFLIHGWPVQSEFGTVTLVVTALLCFLGFMGPMFLITRWVPASCPHCRSRAFLRSEATFTGSLLAPYSYKCTSCGHTEGTSFWGN